MQNIRTKLKYFSTISIFSTKCSNTYCVKSSHGVGTVLALDDGFLVRAVPVLKLRVELDGDDLQVARVVVPGEVTVHTDNIHVRSLWTRQQTSRDALIIAAANFWQTLKHEHWRSKKWNLGFLIIQYVHVHHHEATICSQNDDATKNEHFWNNNHKKTSVTNTVAPPYDDSNKPSIHSISFQTQLFAPSPPQPPRKLLLMKDPEVLNRVQVTWRRGPWFSFLHTAEFLDACDGASSCTKINAFLNNADFLLHPCLKKVPSKQSVFNPKRSDWLFLNNTRPYQNPKTKWQSQKMCRQSRCQISRENWAMTVLSHNEADALLQHVCKPFKGTNARSTCLRSAGAPFFTHINNKSIAEFCSICLLQLWFSCCRNCCNAWSAIMTASLADDRRRTRAETQCQQ